jgi:lipopolysaccharide heptosyltransferase II
MTTIHEWEKAVHILCVRLDALGDVLMTTPAFRALKQSRAGRRLTLLTSGAGAEVAALIPEIDDVISYDAPWLKATASGRNSLTDLAIIDRLRGGCFSAAAIFTVYSQNPLPSALLCYLADIPLRLAHCRENPYQLLTDWVPEREPERTLRHEVRRQLDLVAAVGCRTDDECLSIRIPPEALRSVALALGELGLRPGDRWLVLHPGASAPARRYPPEGFAEAARVLTRDYDCQIVFAGNESEHELVEQIRHEMKAPSHSLVGELHLAEFAALVAAAPLLIANNSGPAHVAAAVGTPVVNLYALTNPQHTPWGVPCRVLSHSVPCKFCYKSVCPEQHHHCLRLIAPAEIVWAASELMDWTQAPWFRRSRWPRSNARPALSTEDC